MANPNEPTITQEINRIKACASRSQDFILEAIKYLNKGDLENAAHMDKNASIFEEAMYKSQRPSERRNTTEPTQTQQTRIKEGTILVNIRMDMAEEYKDNKVIHDYLMKTAERVSKLNLKEQAPLMLKRNNQNGRN